MKKFTLTLLAAVCGLFANAAVSSVDDLVGIYAASGTGTESVSDYTKKNDLTALSYDVEVSKNDDGTINIKNILNQGSTLVGTVDMDAKTISIAPGTVYWATFASATTSDGSGNVTATFDDNGTISITSFGAWYGSTNYVSDGATITLTKANVTKEWSVSGTLAFYDGDDVYLTQLATLTKYNGSSSYDYILEFSNPDADPNNMMFSVDDSGVMSISNGTVWGDYKYFYYLADNLYTAGFYTKGDYSYFSGDEKGGEFYFYHYGYETSSSSDAYSGYVDFSWGTADGISAVTTDKAKDSAIYDLTGRKVTDAKKAGIYIQNGKKFVVK